jgi:hypothetical protein
VEDDEIDRLLEEVDESESAPRREDELPDASLSDAERLERCGPPRWVYRTPYLKGVRFECRPISSPPPPEKTIAFMYRREGGHYTQSGVIAFIDGHWRKEGRGDPLEGDCLWAAMVDER